MSLLQRFTRNIPSKRFFTKSAIRRDDHDLGGEPGKGRHIGPNFGFFFDIDGVIVRGKDVLPSAYKSFKRLVDISNNFRIPTIFVTNSGNVLVQDKAQELSRLLGINIDKDQIVLSHSPLSLFKNYHQKRILVSGQGNVKAIVENHGFRNIITMKEVVKNFPSLDYIDKDKRSPINGPVDKNFEKLDGILLLNEPTNWETSLQLIIDILMTNGMPSDYSNIIPDPHIFVIACNMDLLWMAHAPLPRYGHGAFLLCLEELYKKVSGKKMMYTAMLGKPSLLTYNYANSLLETHARKIGIKSKIDRIYAVGDNINTDICGANFYNKYLTSHKTSVSQCQITNEDLFNKKQANQCISILVETGVHNSTSIYSKQHSHRDFMNLEENMHIPTIIATDVGSAIDKVFKLEAFN